MMDHIPVPDRAELRAWLESFKEGDVVGIRESAIDCPIARHLKSKGCERIMVGPAAIVPDRELATRGTYVDYRADQPMPRWGEVFVTLIDAGSFADDGLYKEVTAREALATLDEVS